MSRGTPLTYHHYTAAMTTPSTQKAPLPLPMGEMSLNCQKFQQFVTEPMDGKPVDTLPGINNVLGSRLRRQGYGRATSLLGKFMVMNKDRYSFVQWLAEKTGASSQQALDCFKCLDAWTDAFM
ncbi:hypothetical protein LSAT2_011906 [Lamellibrachia satsuma]|nr:hypothetical protein LSAT2_011906 [Lamellibrachia satsuma]